MTSPRRRRRRLDLYVFRLGNATSSSRSNPTACRSCLSLQLKGCMVSVGVRRVVRACGPVVTQLVTHRPGSVSPRRELCGIPSTWQRPTARRPGRRPRSYRRSTSCSSASGAACGSPSGGRGDATPFGPPTRPPLPRLPPPSPRPGRPPRASTFVQYGRPRLTGSR